MRQLLHRCVRDKEWRCQLIGILALALLIAVVVYGRIHLVTANPPARLVVYAFSTQKEVMTQGIFPAFKEAWQAESGRDLTIEAVFGPSGTLAGHINLGAPADVALFSNAQHVDWLKFGRRVHRGTEPVLIGHTPMIIVTRPGNPTGVTEFADLASGGLILLHADPRSSGAAEWAVLAEYGSAFLESNDRALAEAQLKAIWQNVRLLAPSARATLTLFELGAGDAFVTYEQDARLAVERGVPLEIVTPPRTIVAQHVAVIVDDNVTSAERPMVQAFVDYLASDPGQLILRRYHLRSADFKPGDPGNDQFPELAQPFTVEDLGGWSLAYTQLVEALWQEEIEPRLDLEPAPMLLGAGGD